MTPAIPYRWLNDTPADRDGWPPDPTRWVYATRLAIEALAVGACTVVWRTGRRLVP